MLKAKLEAVVDQVERDWPDFSVPRAQSPPVTPSGWRCLLSEERYFCVETKEKQSSQFEQIATWFLSMESSQLRTFLDVGLKAPLARVRTAVAIWDTFPGLQLDCLC